jgi:hypothetical protein
MKMRLGSLVLVLLLSAKPLLAQKLKYKDIQEQLLASDSLTIYPLLKAFIKQDTGHAHAHFTIARIFSSMAKKSDPLREFNNSIKLSDSTLFYFAKCKRLITEKEIKKNMEMYDFLLTPEEKKSKDDQTILVKKIRKNLDFNINFFKNYLANITLIFNYFSKASENYAFANTHYVKINTDFNSIKELYLIADDSMKAELKAIGQAYDSSLTYLNLLKKALQAYPLNTYHPEYEIRKIETFRLDGLSGSEFLSNKIMLWDYSGWTNAFLKIMESDIRSLREKIKVNEEKLRITGSLLSEGGEADTVSLYKIDPILVVLLNKYDFNSFLLNLLTYKEQKNYLLKFRNQPFNSTDTCTQRIFSGKTNFFSQYIDLINGCDTTINLCSNYDLNREIKKYSGYFKNYNSEEGMKKYLEKESEFIRRENKEAEKKYLAFMLNQLNKFSDTARYFTYNKSDVPLFTSAGSNRSSMIAKFIKEDKDGNIYTAGIMNNAVSKTSDVYIVRIGKDKRVEWFKTYDLKPGMDYGNDIITSLELTEEGCVVNIFTKSASAVCNTILRLNKDGKEVFNKKTDKNTPVRKIIYDEISDHYILVFKGDSLEQNSGIIEPLSIQFLDHTGLTIKSITKKMTGSLQDVVRTGEGFICIALFKEFEKDSLTMLKASASPSGLDLLVAKINFDGKVGKYKIQQEKYLTLYSIRDNQQVHLLIGEKHRQSNGAGLKNISLLTFNQVPDLVKQIREKDEK